MFLKFENEVMLKIIEANPVYGEKLLNQYITAGIVNRNFTGHGFFTNYCIPDKKFSLGDNINLTLEQIGANINNMKHGAGFVLFIKNGLISCLEGYGYGEPFPYEILKYDLFNTDKK